jgi:hypothetical protein
MHGSISTLRWSRAVTAPYVFDSPRIESIMARSRYPRLTCDRLAMRPLAVVLIIVIPWTAFVTIALALHRGRPPAFHDWDTARIQRRLAEIDAQMGAAPQLRRERDQLWRELFRRGRGHNTEGP